VLASNRAVRGAACLLWLACAARDESGLRVADVLKQKKQAGVDVKVIVDGVNNPSLQTQWMYFDLEQHGIEVEAITRSCGSSTRARQTPRR
jgi:hypothetical protein